MAVLGLRCCTQTVSSCCKRGLLFTVVCGLLICGGFSCCEAWTLGVQASVVVAYRLSCSVACGIFPDQGSKLCPRTSLVVQWLRIRLPVQGTRVRALVQEDPTCCRATKPVHHNYWACVPLLLSPCATTTEACAPRARALQQEKPLQWEAHAPQWRVAPAHCN